MSLQVNSATSGMVISVVFIVALTYIVTRETKVPSEEVKAVAEACAKVGKEPLITVNRQTGIKMGCKE